jgi:hypothetical protein
VNVVERPHLVEAVIGIFYFRALDRVIGVFPLLNRMLLGPDDNLVSTYFAVSGPWADPSASIIPSKSIASGPGSFVLEGLPAFVRGGISTLERIFTASGPKAAPKAENAPTTPLAPPSPAPVTPPSSPPEIPKVARARPNADARSRRARVAPRSDEGSAWCSPTAASICSTWATCAASNRRARRATAWSSR